MAFIKATKSQAKLRMAIMGPSGSGKTMSALAIASGLGERIAVIDSERGSASKYASEFNFDVCTLEEFSVESYIRNIKEAEAAKYEVLIIDSLTHAWAGPGGVLDVVDAAKKSKGGNDFGAWKSGSPLQAKLIDAMLRSKCHVLATMRSKVEYVLEKNDRGQNVPRKVGMAPVQRADIEFEFDIAGTMNSDNEMVIEKTRFRPWGGKVFPKPSAVEGRILRSWLDDGAPAPEQADPAPTFAKAEATPAPKAQPAVESAEVKKLRAQIAAAASVADLEKLIPELQKLPETERDQVRPEYGKRKAELAQKAAPAAREPGSEG
jgi:hypothetical protein